MSGFRGVMSDRKSRLMLVCSGAVIVGVMIYAFMPSQNAIQRSSLPPAPSTEAAQGGTEVSPQYAQTLRTADQQRAQQAQAVNPATGRGAAALPTPIFQGLGERMPSLFGDRQETGREPPPPPIEPPVRPEPDPPPPQVQPQVQQVQPVVQAPPPPPPVDTALIQAMQAQMRTMLGQPIRPAEVTHFVRPNQAGGAGGPQDMASLQAQAQSLSAAMREQTLRSGSATPSPASAAQPVAAQTGMSVRVPARFSAPAAGTILYGQLVGRVNSDVPGPVIGEILQGPLAGARLLGGFQFSEQGVIIQFTSMTVPFRDADGMDRSEVVPIRAFAVDTANLGTAMATSIDRRLFERLALGFATAFLQGMGSAIASSGASTTVLPSGGVSVTTPQLNTTQQLVIAGGAGLGNAARIIDQTYGRRRTTIVVEAGTPFGVLFMDGQTQ